MRTEDPESKKENAFLLKYGEDVHTFVAASLIEANEWIKCIKDVQADAKKSADTQKEIQSFARK
jgi:hypothetical protein